MRQNKKYFLKIMKIELEDLKEDLIMMIKCCEERKAKGELTDHVYLANNALFQNELVGINDFVLILNNIDIEIFQDLDTLIASLKSQFKEQIKRLGLAEAVNVCIQRKMEKVKQYVTKPSILIEERPVIA